jgi:hypothetical protein
VKKARVVNLLDKKVRHVSARDEAGAPVARIDQHAIRTRPRSVGQDGRTNNRPVEPAPADAALLYVLIGVNMSAKDAALREFDGHVLRLAQIANRAEPERFARTSVDVDKLLQLSHFLAEVAGQQPQCADGHPAA